MKYFWGLWFFSVHLYGSPKTTAPYVVIKDTINPGTVELIASTIKLAENDRSPFILISISSTGGYLASSQKIVQTMLTTSIPIVVLVAPKGGQLSGVAHLLGMASDNFLMLPDTTLATTPLVFPGSQIRKVKEDREANRKYTLLAAKISEAKGRDTAWIAKNIAKTHRLTAAEAKDLKLIDDIIAHEHGIGDYMRTKLMTPNGETPLFTLVQNAPHFGQLMLSFLSKAYWSYLALMLGGLLWGMALLKRPRVACAIIGSVLILCAFGGFTILPIRYAAFALLLFGMVLMLAEIFAPSYGAMGIGGLLSILFGSLYLIDSPELNSQLPLSVFLPTIVLFSCLLFYMGYLYRASAKKPIRSGIHLLIGEKGQVKEAVSQNHGIVIVRGEPWDAITEIETTIPKQTDIVIKEVRKNLLVVEPKSVL